VTHDVSPLIRAIARDTRLSPKDTHIWLATLSYIEAELARYTLPEDAFIPIKLAVIAFDADCHASTVQRALQRLAIFGYLERGPREGSRGSVMYRLPPETRAVA
jgi:hypothetical protein